MTCKKKVQLEPKSRQIRDPDTTRHGNRHRHERLDSTHEPYRSSQQQQLLTVLLPVCPSVCRCYYQRPVLALDPPWRLCASLSEDPFPRSSLSTRVTSLPLRYARPNSVCVANLARPTYRATTSVKLPFAERNLHEKPHDTTRISSSCCCSLVSSTPCRLITATHPRINHVAPHLCLTPWFFFFFLALHHHSSRRQATVHQGTH